VLALLQAIGKTLRKHRGVLALFDTECVRTGLLPQELSAALHQLFDARQEDDYRRLDPVLPEEAMETILTRETTTNMAWGDADWSTMYFTTRHTLGRVRLKIPGVPVPRGAL
jgi:uncharacterized protein (UPF0332 family)